MCVLIDLCEPYMFCAIRRLEALYSMAFDPVTVLPIDFVSLFPSPCVRKHVGKHQLYLCVHSNHYKRKEKVQAVNQYVVLPSLSIESFLSPGMIALFYIWVTGVSLEFLVRSTRSYVLVMVTTCSRQRWMLWRFLQVGGNVIVDSADDDNTYSQGFLQWRQNCLMITISCVDGALICISHCCNRGCEVDLRGILMVFNFSVTVKDGAGDNHAKLSYPPLKHPWVFMIHDSLQ